MSTEKGKNPKQPGGKKKGSNKKNKHEDLTPEKPYGNPPGKKKPSQPCFICDEEPYTKDFPHQAEVKKFLKKTSNTSVVLTNPFPNLETNVVSSDLASPS